MPHTVRVLLHRTTIEEAQKYSPALFAKCRELGLTLAFDVRWDGTVEYIQRVQGERPAIVIAPAERVVVPKPLADFCAKNGHLLVHCDQFVNSVGTLFESGVLLAELERRFRIPSTLLRVSIPDNPEPLVVAIPARHWDETVEDAKRAKKPLREHLLDKFALSPVAQIDQRLVDGHIAAPVVGKCGACARSVVITNCGMDETPTNALMREQWRYFDTKGWVCRECIPSLVPPNAKKK